MYYVYLHNNKINNKKYVGITKQKPENRWGLNGYNYRSSPYFYSAIQKYGPGLLSDYNQGPVTFLHHS